MQVPLPLSDRGCRCQPGITSHDVPGSLRGTGRADVALLKIVRVQELWRSASARKAATASSGAVAS